MRLRKFLLRYGGSPVSPPDAPTISVAPTSTSNIRVTITSIDPTATSLTIYRSTDGVSYALIDTISPAAVPYDDSTISAGTTYYHKVGAVNAGGETLSDAAAANTLTLTLISAWNMNESSAGSAPVTRNDSAATANHLTDTNNCASAAGIIGNAALFAAASSQRLSRVSNASLQTGDIDFSIDLWYKPTTLQSLNNIVLIAKTNGNVNSAAVTEYALTMNASNQLVWKVSNGSAFGTLTNTLDAISAGSWYHIVACHDSVNDSLNMWVNGGTVRTAAYSAGGVALAAAPFYVGGETTANRYLDGAIDLVGFWKRVLTSDEQVQRYNGGAGFDPFL